jgi:hypothetical protein
MAFSSRRDRLGRDQAVQQRTATNGEEPAKMSSGQKSAAFGLNEAGRSDAARGRSGGTIIVN